MELSNDVIDGSDCPECGSVDVSVRPSHDSVALELFICKSCMAEWSDYDEKQNAQFEKAGSSYLCLVCRGWYDFVGSILINGIDVDVCQHCEWSVRELEDFLSSTPDGAIPIIDEEFL